MTALVKYEAARAALQAAHDVDEVKDIRDKAQAMAAYAKQAKDTKLVEWASEIKVRAERRAGQMLAEMKVNGARHKGVSFIEECPEGTAENAKTNGAMHSEDAHTLETLGVTGKQSSQWQKVASIPEEKFERAIEQAKRSAGLVTTAAVLRTAVTPTRPATESKEKPPKPKKADVTGAEVAKLRKTIEELTEQKNDLADTARQLEDKLTAFEKTDPDEAQKEIMRLQKRIVRLEGEVERLTISRNQCQNKNNDLIREVKKMQRRLGVGQ